MARSDAGSLREKLVDAGRMREPDGAESRTRRVDMETVELAARESDETAEMSTSDAGSLREKLVDAD